MNKYAIASIAFVALFIVGASFVSAYAPTQNSERTHDRGQFHDQMYPIMEEGTYSDLVEVRENTGYDIMPRVQSEEAFQEMQERHKSFEGHGPHGMNSKRMKHNCPFR